MKALVSHDDNGHFKAFLISDREKLKKFLDEFDEMDGGDYIEWILEDLTPYDKELWDNYKIISNEAWEKLLGNFVQRGTMEIIEL